MNTKQDVYQAGWYERNLEEIDREVGRLALICRVSILDPGVINRVLHDDMSVCGADDNKIAFRKLRELLMLHFAVRGKSADELGQAETAAIETYIIERLTKSFPELAGKWPPG
jgi:hypothetical protein